MQKQRTEIKHDEDCVQLGFDKLPCCGNRIANGEFRNDQDVPVLQDGRPCENRSHSGKCAIKRAMKRIETTRKCHITDCYIFLCNTERYLRLGPCPHVLRPAALPSQYHQRRPAKRRSKIFDLRLRRKQITLLASNNLQSRKGSRHQRKNLRNCRGQLCRALLPMGPRGNPETRCFSTGLPDDCRHGSHRGGSTTPLGVLVRKTLHPE
jgi:hypothetical protein